MCPGSDCIISVFFFCVFYNGVYCLHSSKNPEEAELEDTLNQVVSETHRLIGERLMLLTPPSSWNNIKIRISVNYQSDYNQSVLYVL